MNRWHIIALAILALASAHLIERTAHGMATCASADPPPQCPRN